MYDYSSTFAREDTCAFLLDFASANKDKASSYWRKMRRYYDGDHDIRSQTAHIFEENSLPWKAAQSTDGYLQVESLIEPKIPDFEFCPREKNDSDKAKQRELITRYIVDSNDMEIKNSRNERRLGIMGSAVWKVCWDANASFGKGDVCIDNPLPEQIFPDPTAADVDSCEYIGYVYKMHREKARRVFDKDIKLRGESFENYLEANGNFADFSDKIFDSQSYDCNDDTVTVTEWWFRQTSPGTLKVNTGKSNIDYTWDAGDIGLCIFINGKEVRYIPKYWRETACRMFPFVIYSKIPDDKSIWGKSELEQLIPLIDAQDREMAYAQLNSAFNSNDIILAEENALSDGCTPDNTPGAVWKLRPGMMGKIQRMGNLSGSQGSLYTACSFWRSLVEDTTGNFEVNQGKEPSSVTTATGIALLGERAQSRKALKNIDRSAGFKRLFSLCDMTALEFYEDGRVIELGAAENAENVFKFSDFSKKYDNKKYVPCLDVVIHTGDGISNSKAFSVSALSTLMNMKIDENNYMFVKAYIEAINIPQSAGICKMLEEKFENKDNTKDFEMQGLFQEVI